MKNSRKIWNWIMMLTAFGLLAGCSTASKVFNPYDDEFNCPFSDPGKCTSVKKAYDASVADEEKQWAESTQASCKDGNCPEASAESETATAPVVPTGNSSSQQIYKQRQFETIAGLIQEEDAPVVIPPEVVRILILSYTGSENEMFGFRYAYFFATDPKWMLSTATAE